MKKYKNGFTMAEILIVLMIVGIIMALSIRSIKIIKSSYASLTYFEFNTIKQIAAELIAGQTPTPLLDEDEKPIQLNSTIDGKNGKKLTVINTDDEIFCTAVTAILNTRGKNNCTNFFSAEISNEPYLDIDFSKATPNFSTTNGRRYYVTQRIKNNNVSDLYGFRLIAVDLNGKSKPNSSLSSVRRPPDVVTFLMLDNGEVYPLGVAADNLKISDENTLQYLNSKLKGYNYNSYKITKDQETQQETIEYAYEEDENGVKTGGYRASSAIPSECYTRNKKGKMSCDFGVTYLQNEENNKGEKGALSLFSYRQAYCSSLSKAPTYAKYCENIDKHPLCPPADETLCPSGDNAPQDENSKNCNIDLCTVENVKPLFRFDL